MKIALGTVQFGMNYGVSNKSGKVSESESSKILASARSYGINTLDTAAEYGESESILGLMNLDGWKIISKLPSYVSGSQILKDWVFNSVSNSLIKLRQNNIYAILLHRPSQLLESDGDKIYDELSRLKSEKIISKIGISVYSPYELDIYLKEFDFDLVQAPLNPFDQRIISSGWMGRLQKMGIELHVRSIFLQGLLTMPQSQRPRKFYRWKYLFDDWDSWLLKNNLSAVEACVRFSQSESSVSKIIIGVQSCAQMAENVEAYGKGSIQIPQRFVSDSEELLNPSCWDRLSL